MNGLIEELEGILDAGHDGSKIEDIVSNGFLEAIEIPSFYFLPIECVQRILRKYIQKKELSYSDAKSFVARCVDSYRSKAILLLPDIRCEELDQHNAQEIIRPLSSVCPLLLQALPPKNSANSSPIRPFPQPHISKEKPKELPPKEEKETPIRNNAPTFSSSSEDSDDSISISSSDDSDDEDYFSSDDSDDDFCEYHDDTGLSEAIHHRNVNEVISILSAHQNLINAKIGPYNETPLHMAAEAGNIDIIRYLIDNGANVNALNASGSPLHYISKCSNKANAFDCFRYLVEHGADINAREVSKFL